MNNYQEFLQAQREEQAAAEAAAAETASDTAANAIDPSDPYASGGIDTVGGFGYDYSQGFDVSPYGFSTAPYGYAYDMAQTPYATYGIDEESEDAAQQSTKRRAQAHPALVLGLMLIFFPAGLFTMLFFTRWGAYPKILITLFVLAVVLAIYEILVAKNILALPSIIAALSELWKQYMG